jgi:hypothetical protein
MRKFFLLFLLAPALLGQPAERKWFPDDYKTSPCAMPDKVCKSFNKSQQSAIASERGYDIGQEWVDKHWDELMADIGPICNKIATCFATPGNDYLFCNDVTLDETLAKCSRYTDPEDSKRCIWFLNVFMHGHDRKSLPEWEEMQACAKEHPGDGKERTMETWLEPATFGPDFKGKWVIHALDSETRVPIQAHLRIQSKDTIYDEDVPDGTPTANYPVKWKPKLWRVPNANGHRDVVAPQVFIEKEGYRTETITFPLDVPSMTVEMVPATLKRGKNTITISAKDTTTGEPVEARVMGGQTVLGKTNVPFELEIAKGEKRPEIWVTSLYDRYSDVVVVAAEK